MERLISTRQALVLIRAKVGAAVRLGKVERVLQELAGEGRIAARTGRGEWLDAAGLDAVEGEVRRRGAGWYLRRNVREGADVWVEAGGEVWLVRVPWDRLWDATTGQERLSVPEAVGTWEWPTARLTGVLRRSGEREGVAVYVWQAIEGVEEAEQARLRAQWHVGAGTRREQA